MSQMFRTTLRLDLDKPASANAVALLRQLHAERGLSYSALIVPAVNAYYGKAPADESLRETIRSIVQEELAAPPIQLGDLLQALNIVTSSTAPSPIRSDEPDDDDLDDALDSFDCSCSLVLIRTTIPSPASYRAIPLAPERTTVHHPRKAGSHAVKSMASCH